MSYRKWAAISDNRIMELALYYVTEGLTVPVMDGKKVYDKFAEFKRLIMRGSFTLEQLEDKVYSRFGVIPDMVSDTHAFLSHLQELVREQRHQKKDGISDEKDLT